MIEAYLMIACCVMMALIFGQLWSRQVLSADAGTKKMQEIAEAIQEALAPI